MTKQEVLAAIAEEREYQDAKYGGAAHDKKHKYYEWKDFIIIQIVNLNEQNFKERMIKIAALASAALESLE